MSSLRYLPESLQQMNSKLLAFDIPRGITEQFDLPGVIEFTGAYFPVLHTLVVVGAFVAYIAVTRNFQFTGIFVGIAHGTSRIELRLRGRDSFVDFFLLCISLSPFSIM